MMMVVMVQAKDEVTSSGWIFVDCAKKRWKRNSLKNFNYSWVVEAVLLILCSGSVCLTLGHADPDEDGQNDDKNGDDDEDGNDEPTHSWTAGFVLKSKLNLHS